MNTMAVQGVESYRDLTLWPDHKTGIVLLATQVADHFFSLPTNEGGNVVAVVVKGPEPGKEAKGLRMLTLSPMGDFGAPEEKAAWGMLFAMLMGEPDSIAGFQSFEGRTTEYSEGEVTARHEDVYVQAVFTQDDGPIQLRRTIFHRNDEGIAVPGTVDVVEGDDLNLRGRMTGVQDEDEGEGE